MWFDFDYFGSCQYRDILAYYYIYFQIRRTLSIDETLDILDIEFEFDGIATLEEIKKGYVKVYENDLEKEKNKPNSNINMCDWAERDLEIVKARIKNVNNPDELMVMSRNLPRRLWGVVSELFGLAFKNSKLPKFHDSDYEIGFQCAALKEYGIIKNDKSFADFDT